MDVPQKANRILNFVLLAFVLIAARVWFLAIVQHETYVEIAKRPQKRTIVEKAPRGTIRDRFNIPLAINKATYSAGVCYDAIREIPRVAWEGKKKTFPRKEYIGRLAQFLAHELDLSPTEIEDVIHSKASLFPNTPFVLRKELSEKKYYTLKGREREWPGLVAVEEAERWYPQGPLASQVIGYLGKMDHGSYHAIANEIKTLETYLTKREEGQPVFLPKKCQSVAEVQERLKSLKEKTYQFDDAIGRSGIERSFERALRGVPGKAAYLVDTKGHLLHRHPGGREPESGDRLLLSLSVEMQDLAEKLLAENERLREGRFALFSPQHASLTPPWMKGGAIVAMIPQTGEVVAMASYPRANPNDFIQKREIDKWLETKSYVGSIWDGARPLEREVFCFRKNAYDVEKKELTWETYLSYVLSRDGSTRKAIDRVKTVGAAGKIVSALEALLDLSEQSSVDALIGALYGDDSPLAGAIREALAQHGDHARELRTALESHLSDIALHEDRLLFLDLLRLCIGPLPNALLPHIGSTSLSAFRKLSQEYAGLQTHVKAATKRLFCETDFVDWREREFQRYLQQKRREEKERKTYQRPYLEYLERAKRRLFALFWEEHRMAIIEALLLGTPLSDELAKYPIYAASGANFASLQKTVRGLSPAVATAYLRALRGFDELKEPLYGQYGRFGKKQATTQDLARAFYPQNGFGFSKSFAHGEATPLGSIFKAVVAYEALQEKGAHNPLTLIDEYDPHKMTSQGMVLGYTEEGREITRRYKGGRLPKSHARIGKVDLPTAMERSSNIYFSLLASDVIKSPEHLLKTTHSFGFGQRSGIALPGEFPGLVPRDICENKSALYAMAIGQHSLLATPLQTATFLATLANGGKRLQPQIVSLRAQSAPEKQGEQGNGALYTQAGIHFPLFFPAEQKSGEVKIAATKPKEVTRLPLPKAQKTYLFDAMKRVFTGTRGSARPNALRYLWGNPKVTRSYLEIKDDLIGKTSTAEFAYRPTLDREMPPILGTHIWFGALSFAHGKGYDEPELAIIVYLQHGDYGKEAAPLAAQLAAKWREIKENSQ